MPPAARLGDLTSHGTPLTGAGPAGSLDVLIAGQPAWRAAVDAHVCPLVSGTVPHTSGVVPIGSTSVLINGQSAVRQGDQIIESGPPNAVSAGCPTVLIGG